MRSSSAFLRAALLCLLLAGWAFPSLGQQGTLQVLLPNVPPVLTAPYLSDLQQDLERGQYPIQFVYTNTDASPLTFRLRVRFERNGQVWVESTSNPITITPGVTMIQRPGYDDLLTFNDDAQSLIDRVPSRDQLLLATTGALPEGIYTISLTPEVEGGAVVAVPSFNVFQVRYTSPPVAFLPQQDARVSTTPIFAWTPVLPGPGGQIVYRIRLVEVLPGQNDEAALAANRTWAEAEVTEATWTYTLENQPLEEGKRYAWTVVAVDLNERTLFLGDGRSRTQGFVFAPLVTPVLDPVAGELPGSGMPYVLDTPSAGTFFDDPRLSFAWSFGAAGGAAVAGKPITLVISPVGGVPLIRRTLDTRLGPQLRYTLSAAEARQLTPGMYQWGLEMEGRAASETRMLQFGEVVPDVPEVVIPARPIALLQPAMGAEVTVLTPEFAWSAPVGAGTELVFRANEDPAAVVLRVPVAEGSTSYRLTANEALSLGVRSFAWTLESRAGLLSSVSRFAFAPALPFTPTAPSGTVEFQSNGVMVEWTSGNAPDWMQAIQAEDLALWIVIEDARRTQVATAQALLGGMDALFVPTDAPLRIGQDYSVYLEARSRSGARMASRRLTFQPVQGVVTLEGPTATATDFFPTFRWRVPEGLPIQSLTLIVEGVEDRGIRLALPIVVGEGGVPSARTLTPEQAFSLPTGKRYQWTLVVNGERLPAQIFRYAPRLEATLQQPSAQSTVLPDNALFRWQAQLPANLGPDVANVLLVLEQGNARSEVAVPANVNAWTVDLGRLVRDGFNPADSISWRVMLSDRGTGTWQASSGSARFRLGMPGFAFTAPEAGSTVNALLPTISWAGLQTPERLALVLSVGGDTVHIPLPANAQTHTLTARQVLRLAGIASLDDGIEARLEVNGAILPDAHRFFYAPRFAATLGEATFDAVQGRFSWTLDGIPQELAPFVEPMLILNDDTGPNAFIGGTPRGQVITQQELTALRGTSWRAGQSYQWRVALTSQGTSWSALSSSTAQVVYAAPAPPIASVFSETQPTDGLTLNTFDPVFNWRLTLPEGVALGDVRVRLTVQERAADASVPPQMFVVPATASRQQVSGLRQHATYEWTLDLLPPSDDAPLPDALMAYSSDQLRTAVQTFTVTRTYTVPDRFNLFATPFARMEEPTLQSDPATGLLQGVSELILELDPEADEDTVLPAIQGEDVAPPAPVQPQGRTLPVDIQNLQVVVTSEGNVVPVGGGLTVDLQRADPSEAFRLPFPGFDLSSISWGRIDGRLSIPQIELDALQGLSLEDILGRGIGALRIGGRLRLPQEGLACNGGEVTIDLAASSLTLRPSGTVEGTLVVPITCEFAVGPFTARITQSVLHFAGGRSGQRATLDAEVEVQISENQTAVGAMTYDLVRQRVVAFSAELTQPFDLPLPLSAPVFTFNVQRAQINLDNLVIDGRQTLALPGGQSLGVTFDSLGVRLRDGAIAHGQIVFDDGLALQAGIDAAAQGAQGFRFEAVAYDTLGTHFTLTDGVYLGVGAQASLGVDGFQAEGQARAMLRVGDLRVEETLIATFDETARLGLLPPSVTEGRIDISWRGVNVAWADPAGFHLDRTALLGAVLPDTLPLPTIDIAYLVLRDPVSQELRVTYEFQNDGTIRFDQRPGYQMEIVAPALASPAGVIPRMQVVTFRDVRFGLGRIVSGGIYAEVARFEDALDLTGINIPMLVTGLGFAGLPADSPDGIEGFQIKGVFAPFNAEANPANVFSLALSGDRLIGSVDFPALEQNINVAGNGQVVLDLSSVTGSLDVPLPHRIAQTGPGEFDFTFDGRLAVRNADEDLVAASDLTLVLQRQGGLTSLQTFNPAPVIIPETAWLGLPGPLDLGIDSLRTYSLAWVEGSGFTFEMDFDAQVRIGLTGAQGDPFQFPLVGVRLDEQGFTIPPQSWHEGNVPGLANHPGYDFNVGLLYPRAMRTLQTIRFSWFQPGVQFSNAFLPEFDFRVRMADFYGSNPVEDGHDLFFENVTFRNGVLEGTFTYEAALTDPVTGRPLRIATLPLGPSNLSPAPPAIAVERVMGTLRAGAQGQQVLELGIEGYLPPAVGPFAPADPAACPYAEVSLTLVEGPGLAGSVSGVAACLERDFGPITLRALSGQNSLTFAFGNGQQEARFDGGVQIELPPVQDGGARPAFNGTVALDLVRGTFLDGEIRTNAPFSIPVPLQAADPLFTVTVQEAVLNRAGFTLTGNGNLRVPEGSVGIAFDSLRFNLNTGALVSGEATLTSQLALESAVSPLDFRFVDPTATPLAIDDVPQEGFRVDVNGSVTLNRDGLHLNGAATAGLRAFDTNSPGLRVAFDPDEPDDQGFSLGFNRRAVVGGKATFFVTLDGREAPLVTLTRNGWEVDPLRTVAEALIPDTLFLPSRDIAYLVLRDTDVASPTFGQLRVDHTSTPGVVATLPNLPVKLSIPLLGIGTGQRAAIDVAFSARVDAQYNIIVDTLLVDFDADAISLGSDFPFELVGASYVRARANPFGVMARLDLEQLLGGQPGTPLLFDIQVGPNGLSGVAEAGIVRNAFDPVQLTETPVLTLGSAQEVQMFIRGVRFSFGGATPSYALSGDLTAAVLQPTSLSGAPTNEQAGRLFLAGSFASGAWNFTATSAGAGTLKFGAATFQPDAVDGLGFTLTASAQGSTAAFIMNGQMHFGSLLDGFSLEVEDLRMGVRRNAAGWQSVLTLGRAANLSAHQLQLFGGAAQLNIPANGAQLSISNTALQATIGQGQPASMRFRGTDRNVLVQNMVVSTRGTFTFDEIAVQNVGMVGEWVSVNRIGLRKPQATTPVELVVDATVTLPDPFAASSQLEIAVRKTPQGNIQFQVDGPTFVFGANGPTVAFGDVGRLVLTGFSLEPNLQNNLPPVFYVTSEFVFGADPAAPNARRIALGNAANVRNNYGIRVTPRGLGSCAADEVTLRGACVGYRVAYQGQPIEVDLALINLRLDYIGLQPANNDPFTLEVRGMAGLNLPGVGGRAGFEDFRFNRSGLINAGRFANGAAFFLLPSGENDGLLRVEVGSFASGSNTSIQVERGSGSNASPSLVTQTVQVRRFLRFGGQGQPALQLTINAADLPISAGVREVLFYETTTGTKYLRVSDANLSLHDQLSVNASFEYEGSANNTLVRVSGRGSFAGQSVVAVGKFARGQQGLSVGVFVAATTNAGIPLVPGLVDLTGIGGGFFLRPDPQDFQMVNNAVNLWNDPYLIDRRDAVIGRNSPTFSIFLYASAGFVGSNGVYALRGQALVTITDDFSMIQSDATVAGVNNVRAGLVLAVEYTPAAITGAVLLELDIPVVLNLRAGMDFFASSQTWGINGFIEGELLRVLTIRGDLFLGPPGYYLGVSVRNGRDFGVFSYSATLEFEVWNVRGSSFGAYLAANASVRAFGIGFSAGVKGAYIARSSRRFVYGSAYVELDWLPDFRGWVKFENGGIDGGLGRNKEYERLISQARGEAQAMAGQAQQAATQLTQAQQDLETARQQALADAQEAAELQRIANAPQLRPLELMRAGVNMIAAPQAERQDYINRLRANEFRFGPNDPGRNWILNTVLAQGLTPYDHSTRLTRLQQRLVALNSTVPGVEDRLRNAQGRLENLLISLQDDADALTAMRSPVTVQRGADRITGFAVDTLLAAQQASTLEAEMQANEQLDAEYRTLLQRATNNLAQFDQVLTGRVGQALTRLQILAQTQINRPAIFVVSGGGKNAGGTQQTSPNRGPAFQPANPASRVSVEEAARLYMEATETLTEYYAYRLDEVWRNYTRTDAWIREFQVQKGTLLLAIPAQGAAYVGGNANRYRDAADISRERYRILTEALRMQPPGQMANALHQSLNFRPDTQPARDAHRATFERVGREFWVDAFESGLSLHGLSAAISRNTVTTRFNRDASRVMRAHESLTEAIDDLYDLKVDYATTLYSLYDAYYRWRASTGQETQEVNQRLSELASALTPPRVTNIGAIVVNQANSAGFRAQGLASWSITPAPGDSLAEISIRMHPTAGPGSTPYQARYRTLGRLNYLPIHTARTNSNENTHTFALGVRARSSGGATAERTGSFTVSVNRSAGNQNTIGGILPADNTPPVFAVAPRVEPSRVTAAGETVVYGQTLMGANSVTWLSNQSIVRLTVRVSDPESGIESLEYAFGTAVGGTDVQEFRPLFGDVVEPGRIEAIVRSLELPEDGTPAYLTVRATNGAGRTAVSASPHPVRFDGTAPSVPTRVRVRPVVQPSVNTTPVQTTAPALTLPTTAQRGNDPAAQAANRIVEWSAPDVQGPSGIANYSIVVAPERLGADAFTDPRFTPTSSGGFLTLNANALSYTDTMYVHIRPRSRSMATGATVMQPLLLQDPTPPSAPNGVLAAVPGALRFYITTSAEDSESGVDRYELAIGTTPGGQDVISWRSPRTMPWSVGPTPRFFHVPNAELPQAPVYFSVRAVNRQGAASRPVTSGPLFANATPPATLPAVGSVQFMPGTQQIRVPIVVNADPVGTMSVTVEVQELQFNPQWVDPALWQTIQQNLQGVLSWPAMRGSAVAFSDVAAPNTRMMSLTGQVTLAPPPRAGGFAVAPVEPDPRLPRRFEITVRVTNAGGLSVTRTFTHVHNAQASALRR